MAKQEDPTKDVTLDPGTKLAKLEPAVIDSLPTTLTVEVQQPTSCQGVGTVSLSGSRYSGSSADFNYILLFAVDVGGGVTTWELRVTDVRAGTGCPGLRRYRRNPAANNPVGDYCYWNGSSMNCSTGKAGVWT